MAELSTTGNRVAVTCKQQEQPDSGRLQFQSCSQQKDPEQAMGALETNIKQGRKRRYCSGGNITRLKPSMVQPSDEMEMSWEPIAPS